jgi:hypothetical protein
MLLAAAVEVVIGVAHRLGTPPAEHHLHVHRLQAVVVEAVNNPGWAGDAFPCPELAADLPTVFVFEKHCQIALEDKKNLLDFVGMRCIALARRDVDDAESEAAGRDSRRVVVFAGAAGADEAMLGAAVAFNLGILESRPIGLLVAKAPDIALGDLVER